MIPDSPISWLILCIVAYYLLWRFLSSSPKNALQEEQKKIQEEFEKDEDLVFFD